MALIARLRELGLFGTFGYALRKLDAGRSLKMRPELLSAFEAVQAVREDVRPDLEARELVSHIPTNAATLGAFREVMRKHAGVADGDVFFDYGCGAGMAMLMASTLPFRVVAGVEFDPKLVDVALRTLRIDGAAGKFRIDCADATTYPLPDDVSVVYFFNPFFGAPLDAVLGQIRQSLERRPRPLRVVCYNPDNFVASAVKCPWLGQPLEVQYPECRYRFNVYTIPAGA